MKFHERATVERIAPTTKEAENNDVTRWRATLNSGDITANGRRYNWKNIEWDAEGVPVLFNHGGGGLFGGDFWQELPVGHSDKIELKGKGIEGVFHFGEDEHSRVVAEKWEAGLFDGISVGVIPHTTTEVEATGDVPAHIVVDSGRLVEFSTVTIPADPKGRGHGKEQMAAVLRELYGDNFDPEELARISTNQEKLLTIVEAIQRDTRRVVEYQTKEEQTQHDAVWERVAKTLKS